MTCEIGRAVQIRELVVRISPSSFSYVHVHRCSDAAVTAGHRRRTGPQSLQVEKTERIQDGKKRETNKKDKNGVIISPAFSQNSYIYSYIQGLF